MIRLNKYYVAGLILFAILAIAFGGVLFYSLTYFLIGTGFVSLYILVKSVNKIGVILSVDAKDGNRYRLRIDNDSKYSIATISTIVSLPKRLYSIKSNEHIASMESNSKVTFYSEEVKGRRGIYSFGKCLVTISDPFGIIFVAKSYYSECSIVIYPKLHLISRLSLTDNLYFGDSPTNKHSIEDLSSVRDIREYYVGDSIKRIHWKLSAKSSKLLVKNFESRMGKERLIILDLNIDKVINDEEIEESCVETTLSLVYFYLKNKIPISLVCYQDKKTIITGDSLARYNHFLEFLTSVIPQKSSEVEDILELESRRLGMGGTIIVITPLVTSGISNKLLSLKGRGQAYSVIEVNQSNNNSCFEYLDGYTKISCREEIKQVLEG